MDVLNLVKTEAKRMVNGVYHVALMTSLSLYALRKMVRRGNVLIYNMPVIASIQGVIFLLNTPGEIANY